MSSVFALLVGVSDYHPDSGVSGLNGCVNDVNAMRGYLRNQFPQDPAGNILTLVNSAATRAAVTDAFKSICARTPPSGPATPFCSITAATAPTRLPLLSSPRLTKTARAG